MRVVLLLAKQVEEAMRTTGWDPEDGPWDGELYSESDGELSREEIDAFPLPVSNRILGSIAFNRHPRPPTIVDPADGFLRCYTFEGIRSRYDDRVIVDHPIAWRSMATFPALKRFEVSYDSQEGFFGDMCDVVESRTVINVRSLMNHIKERYLILCISSCRSVSQEVPD